MNEIHKRTIVIEFDMWAPMKRQTEDEIDALLGKLKDKSLLQHAGNVKATLRSDDK